MEGGKGHEDMSVRVPSSKAGPKFSPTTLALWVIWLIGVCRVCNYQTKILSSVPFDKKNPKHKIRMKDREARSSRKEKSRHRKKAKDKGKSQHSVTLSLETFPGLKKDLSHSSSLPTYVESKDDKTISTIKTPKSEALAGASSAKGKTSNRWGDDTSSSTSNESSMSASGYSSADSLEFGYQMASPLAGLEVYTEDLGADVLWTDGYDPGQRSEQEPMAKLVTTRNLVWIVRVLLLLANSH